MRPKHVKSVPSGARDVPEGLRNIRYATYVTAARNLCDDGTKFGPVAGARHRSIDGRHSLMWYGATPLYMSDLDVLRMLRSRLEEITSDTRTQKHDAE